ncbi:MAG: MBL fold metallo-hydrolase, partial [Lachnospiraceae bacterium]|nr:MBL fold metallo-hydrolase [Lachnospiraceae bacterium]
ITHPHGDHAGALYKILQDEAAGIQSGIQIDGIYYSFAEPEWYTINDPSEQTMAHAIIGSFSGLPETMRHTVTRGQTIQVDDVTIQVMNDRYDTASDKGNNASIVYKLWVNGKSILFLGDMAEEGGQRLLSEVGVQGLKSDIVQMAHHGQNGVDEAFYKAVAPQICLWPTPQWLWNSVGSRYRTSETKGWMTRLNVQKHYCTKDGDLVIR